VIVVDTSVWVAALCGARSSPAGILNGLLDADEVALALPVRLELLAGSARADRAALRRVLTALPVIHPDETVWRRVEGWVERAADRGQRFGLTDLLIGAMAEELGALVWSLDGDFRRMEALRFVRLYSPGSA
jgi:predicted nucleic acid-binding protein